MSFAEIMSVDPSLDGMLAEASCETTESNGENGVQNTRTHAVAYLIDLTEHGYQGAEDV